jgi:ribonuclease HI
MSADRARFVLMFDGGSRGNPGAAYGSFRLQRTAASPLPIRRLTFGHGTNNEAEYKALLAGLEELGKQVAREGLRPADVEIEVRGDSRLVLEQLRGAWRVRNSRLAGLHRQAAEMLEPYAQVRLVHQDRSRSVRVLGH